MPFIELQSVDSTNNYALARIHAGLAQDGEAVFAHEQVAGKGQRGKQWTAEKNANIALSLLVKQPPFPLEQQFRLSVCTAVAVRQFFSKYAGDDTKIKWPNDLYWQDRKAGGILIESVIGSQASVKTETMAETGSEKMNSAWQWAVVGIGINCNQTVFPGDLRNPVSLKQITGRRLDVMALAKELQSVFHDTLDKAISGFDELWNYYLAHLYKKDQPVKLKKDSRVFEAVIKTVLPSGQLLVQHSMEEAFDFGQVEWVIHSPQRTAE